MDDYELERPELTGNLITMEFGQGGRIQQMWVADPQQPDGEEFQFVCPPVPMGDEFSEDYFPGTILLGARTHPDDPWIVSRNSNAKIIETGEDGVVAFEYEFAFLEELGATGRFYEIAGVAPQICWELRIANQSRRSVEIGELAFPLALNSIYEGYQNTDKAIGEFWNDRVIVHKCLAGASSYVFAQRMNARPPGLLIYPGDNTSWEFYNHIVSSLHTPYRWEGIPTVYIYSKAAVEREEWDEWLLKHTSIVLEPGEERTYQMRFASGTRETTDQVAATLASVGKASIKLFPAAVAPYDVGIAIEVSGVTPATFQSDVAVELETDSDEDGGFCFLRPQTAEPVTVSFDDTKGSTHEVNLLFTRPITELIHARAGWISNHQVVDEGPLEGAILPADLTNHTLVAAIGSEAAIEGGLADALFLATKNLIYPDPHQIRQVDRFLTGFVESRLRNPMDGSVGSLLPHEHSVAVGYGVALPYALTWNLYHVMSQVATRYGGTLRETKDYLAKAAQTASSMIVNTVGGLSSETTLPLMGFIHSLIDDLRAHSLVSVADDLEAKVKAREREVARRRYPVSANSLYDTASFEEVFTVASRRRDADKQLTLLRALTAARSLSPNWWWYGSDKVFPDLNSGPEGGYEDKGEVCLGHPSAANSFLALDLLCNDSAKLNEIVLRQAFGGLLGIWALVRPDGAASQSFCPDAASEQFGMSWTTGLIGLGLYHYLRRARSIVLPQHGAGLITFGCHFEVENDADVAGYSIRPWDGVCQRVMVRQIGFDVEIDMCQIEVVRLDPNKRWVSLVLHNPADKDLKTKIRMKGLWGTQAQVDGCAAASQNGFIEAEVSVPAHSSQRFEVQVLE